jgi:alpha-2,3 sialyltransferase
MERIENILICGNGPSVGQIDFRRVPKEAKVFRMTNFYFEDKYYAGRKVDYYLNYVIRLDNSYFDLRNLNEKGEYEVDMFNIWMTVMFEKNEHFPTVKMATPLIQQKIEIAEFRCFYQYYYGQYPPTGMQAIPLAAMLGFKNIYITGYDFFTSLDNLHIYKSGSEKIVTEEQKGVVHAGGGGIYQTKGDESSEYIKSTHPVELQIKFLMLIKKIFSNVHFLSVSEDCLINEYLDLAPVIYDTPWYTPEKKPADRIMDYFPLPETMPSRMKESVQ